MLRRRLLVFAWMACRSWGKPEDVESAIWQQYQDYAAETVLHIAKAVPVDAELIVASIFKNECTGWVEWIEHHLDQGVDFFVMFDNNSTDSCPEWQRAYSDKVVVVEYPVNYKQRFGFNLAVKALQHAVPEAWLGIFDLDEFVYGTRSSLKSAVKTLSAKKFASPPAQLCATWIMYGSDGRDVQPDCVSKGFTLRGSYEDPDKGRLVKCIVKLSKTTSAAVHQHEVAGTTLCPDGSKALNGPKACATTEHSLLHADLWRINHYAIQSRSWFAAVKSSRGSVSSVKHLKLRDMNYFQAYDATSKQVFDDTLARVSVCRGDPSIIKESWHDAMDFPRPYSPRDASNAYVRHPSALIRYAAENPGVPVRLTEPSIVSSRTRFWYVFGYFDKSQLSSDLTKGLVLRTKLTSTNMPSTLPSSLEDMADVGYVDTNSGAFVKFAETSSWNYQQGSMLQWLGYSNRYALFNLRDASTNFQTKAAVYDVVTKKAVDMYDFPIYDVSDNGRVGTSIDFARLWACRPDYGYYATPEQKAQLERCPSDDGVWIVDMLAKTRRLALSLRGLVERMAVGGDLYSDETKITTVDEQCSKCKHWVNHAQINENGTLMTFLFRFQCPGAPFRTSQLTMRPDGSDLWRIPGFSGSHHDVRGDRVIGCTSSKMVIVDAATKDVVVDAPPDHGHCSMHPYNRDLVLSDTYTQLGGCQPRGCKRLFLRALSTAPKTPFVEANADQKFVQLAAFEPAGEAERPAKTPLRTDLHPRWTHQGDFVTFDSVHETDRRASYLMYVGHLIKPQRRVFIDLGAYIGDTIEKLAKKWHPETATSYEVYAFEANPDNIPRVVTYAQAKAGTPGYPWRIDVIPVAVTDFDGVVYFKTDTRNVKTGGSIIAATPHATGDFVPVPSARFTDFLQRTVNQEDYVSLKIDVEGAEFAILEDMMKQGSFKLVDEIYVEWHHRFVREKAKLPAAYKEIFDALGISVVIIA